MKGRYSQDRLRIEKIKRELYKWATAHDFDLLSKPRKRTTEQKLSRLAI